MKYWVYILCYRESNGDPAFIHRFVKAENEDDAYIIGAKIAMFGRDVLGHSGINDYVVELPDSECTSECSCPVHWGP